MFQQLELSFQSFRLTKLTIFVWQVREVRLGSAAELRLGSRVCVYWSDKISFLHPGLVTGLEEEPGYVVVSTDDGDTRDVRLDQVRLLPPDFATLGKHVACGIFTGLMIFHAESSEAELEHFKVSTESGLGGRRRADGRARCTVPAWQWEGAGWGGAGTRPCLTFLYEILRIYI